MGFWGLWRVRKVLTFRSEKLRQRQEAESEKERNSGKNGNFEEKKMGRVEFKLRVKESC